MGIFMFITELFTTVKIWKQHVFINGRMDKDVRYIYIHVYIYVCVYRYVKI